MASAHFSPVLGLINEVPDVLICCFFLLLSGAESFSKCLSDIMYVMIHLLSLVPLHCRIVLLLLNKTTSAKCKKRISEILGVYNIQYIVLTPASVCVLPCLTVLDGVVISAFWTPGPSVTRI